MSKPRIAFVTHGLGNGGAERVASILASDLSRRGYKILYLAIYDKRVTYDLHKEVQYKYLGFDNHNKITKYLIRSINIYKEIKKFDPQYVISFITQEMPLLSLLSNYKIIYSERTDPASKPILVRMITEYLYKCSYKVVFQTEGAKEYFGNRIKNKAYIIANPLETKSLPIWNMNGFNKRIITACRITPEKNLYMLIRAFAKVVREHRDYELYIFGEPRYPKAKQELIDLAVGLGISDYIKFPGYSTDIHEEMARSAIFTLTSNYEGLSNSMLEALCIGIPTICTNCPSGGAAMYIKNGENGFLIEMNDFEMLAKRINEIIESSDLQSYLSRHSMLLKDKISVDFIVDQWELLLN